jgi:hypothetical protein
VESEETVIWAFVLPFMIILAIAALVGFYADLRQGPRRERLLTSNQQRAQVMQDYYGKVHGAEV